MHWLSFGVEEMHYNNAFCELGLLLALFSNIFFFIAELNKNPVEGFSAGLIDDDDIYKWEVVIIGPQDTLL